MIMLKANVKRKNAQDKTDTFYCLIARVKLLTTEQKNIYGFILKFYDS